MPDTLQKIIEDIGDGVFTNPPRVKFCWECGRKLWGNHHVIRLIEGHPRTLHKSCGAKYEEGQREVG